MRRFEDWQGLTYRVVDVRGETRESGPKEIHISVEFQNPLTGIGLGIIQVEMYRLDIKGLCFVSLEDPVSPTQC